MTILSIGLQEWAVTCTALSAGATLVIVRKGGIHERHGGLFAPEHEHFALLPTRLHQDAGRLRPDVAEAYADQFEADPEPGVITITAWAETICAWKVTDRARLTTIADELIWSDAEIDTRFRYRDQPWLFVLALRVHRLGRVQTIPDRPAYAGCRSWIPLQDTVDLSASQPVLSDAQCAERLAALDQALGVSPSPQSLAPSP